MASPVRNIKKTPRKKISNRARVFIKNLQKRIPINPKRIRRVVLNILSFEGKKNFCEITLCFLKDKQIRELNLRYFGRDYPTDVMAFDNSQNKPHKAFGLLGGRKEISADIAISTDMAIRHARIFKTAPIYELYLYIIHGILHLLGYDDKNIRQRKIMKNKTKCILNRLNIELITKKKIS